MPVVGGLPVGVLQGPGRQERGARDQDERAAGENTGGAALNILG